MTRRTSAAALAAILIGATAATPVLTAAPALAAPAAAGFETITRDGVSVRFQRVTARTTPQRGVGPTRSDFDGDGIDDIAAKVRGGVVIRYSSTPAVDYLAGPTPQTQLGQTLAAGDFSGDGFADLVVGDPGEIDPAVDKQAGGLWILIGSPSGLQTASIQHINQNSDAIPDASENGDRFAYALAVGDLNGDGRDDLAVGVPGESSGTTVRAAGAVLMLFTGDGNVGSGGATWLDQGNEWVPDDQEADDEFGAGLAIGHFNPDPYEDLVIGSPGEQSPRGASVRSGMISVLLGGANGPNLVGIPYVYGDDFGSVAPTVQLNGLGRHLVLTDTNGDSMQDIIMGVPAARVNGIFTAGAVVTARGNRGSLFTEAGAVVTQNTPGVPDAAEEGDAFGASLAAGEITGDGLGDVLVGIPGEDDGSTVNAGAATLLPGTPSGPSGSGSQFIGQATAGSPERPEAWDTFGSTVAILNLNGRGGLDAAVSAPEEKTTGDTTVGSGTVTTYVGQPTGLTTARLITGRSLAIAGMDGTLFGVALAAPQSN